MARIHSKACSKEFTFCEFGKQRPSNKIISYSSLTTSRRLLWEYSQHLSMNILRFNLMHECFFLLLLLLKANERRKKIKIKKRSNGIYFIRMPQKYTSSTVGLQIAIDRQCEQVTLFIRFTTFIPTRETIVAVRSFFQSNVK